MPKYQHKKRGTTYERLGDAPLQCAAPFTAAEGQVFTVYVSDTDGRMWVRPINEFDDGRFEALADDPQRVITPPGFSKPVTEPEKKGRPGPIPAGLARTILTDMLVHLFENDEKIERMFEDYQPRVEAFLRRKMERREI